MAITADVPATAGRVPPSSASEPSSIRAHDQDKLRCMTLPFLREPTRYAATACFLTRGDLSVPVQRVDCPALPISRCTATTHGRLSAPAAWRITAHSRGYPAYV